MNFRCCVCGEFFDLHRSASRIADRQFPMQCSIGCLKKHIRIWKFPKINTGELLTSPDWKIVPKPAHMLSKHMRSEYEYAFAKLFKEHNIEYRYEPFAIRLENGDRYVPDFYLPEYWTLVECKGTWGMGAKKKFKRVLLEVPSLIIVQSYLCDKIVRLYGDKIIK